MIHWTDIVGQLAQAERFKITADRNTVKLSSNILDNDGKILIWQKRYFEGLYNLSDCTLIARSVNDMTEEEYDTCLGLLGGNTVHNNEVLIGYFEGDLLNDFPTPLFLYLISIGVLPPNVSTQDVEFITQNGE